MNEESVILERCKKMSVDDGVAFFASLNESREFSPEARRSAFRIWAGLDNIDPEKWRAIRPETPSEEGKTYHSMKEFNKKFGDKKYPVALCRQVTREEADAIDDWLNWRRCGKQAERW